MGKILTKMPIFSNDGEFQLSTTYALGYIFVI